jgi:transcriptional regulator with GAF, ATPase, and Fis domain
MKKAQNETLKDRVGRTEREMIVAALGVSYGCVAAAARWLRIPLSTMRYKMKKLSIDPNEFRPAQDATTEGETR